MEAGENQYDYYPVSLLVWQHRRIETVLSIAAALVVVSFWWMGKQTPPPSHDIPLPFVSESLGLAGAITNLGVRGGRNVQQATFSAEETSVIIPVDSMTIVIVPARQDVSGGAALSEAMSAGKRVFGYKYASASASQEIAARARANAGEPLSYAELFPGTFFVSDEARAASTFIAAFEAQKNIEFLPITDVTLEADARYVVVATDTETAFTISGLGAEASCSDGIITAPETCDDGNATPGDGCDDTCAMEQGFTCSGQPSVCTANGGQSGGGGGGTTGGGGGGVCGNNVVESGEECDDGNIVSGDGCGGADHPNGACSLEFCGDKYVDTDGIPDEEGSPIPDTQEACDEGGLCQGGPHDGESCSRFGIDPFCGNGNPCVTSDTSSCSADCTPP